MYSRWPSDAILDFIEPEIAPFDPPMPKTHELEPNMEWIECAVCEIFTFKLYCDLETKVQGNSRSSKAALFDGAHTNLYSSSISNYASIYYRFQDIAAYWLKIAIPPVVFRALVRGETLRFTQQLPLVTKTTESRAYQIVKEFR